MASIYDFKPRFQALLRPLVKWLAMHHVTANHVTIAAMVLSIGVGLLLVYSPSLQLFLLVPLVLFVRMALNAIDGMLAREHDQQSALGALLNEMGDVVSDAALYLPLALALTLDASFVVLMVVLALMTEMMGSVAIQIGAQRRYDGPMGKSDRAFVVGVLCLLLGLGVEIAIWGNRILLLMIVLLLVTLFNRGRQALLEVSS